MPGNNDDRTRRVLVVDDYPAMVKMTCELIKLCGYDALGYTDPRKAVADFPRLDDVVVAMTDQSMPGMDGIEVARALLAQSPALPVVLMSAVGDDRLTPVYRDAGFRTVLSKPFTLERLRDCLDELVTERS